MELSTIFVLILAFGFSRTETDRPCAAKVYPGESVVCVCNGTYCDDISREAPGSGQYVTYTSTGDGLRLKKAFGTMKQSALYTDDTQFDKVLTLHSGVKYQKIEGFGGAVTDSSGINWKNLSEPVQQALIDAYYGPKGIGYNMARLPIAGTDFSTRNYTYNDLPINDTTLSNFSLAYEDFNYKIPMLKKIQAASQVPVKIVSSLWSPPDWMKKKSDYNSCGHLKEEHYQTYANYYLKFIQEYAAQGIDVWAITTGNEPIIGFLPLKPANCLGWYPQDMGKWIVNNLGPTIRNNTKVLILAGDDQRFTIPIWVYGVIKLQPDANQYMDGIAIHFYGDVITPASLLDDVSASYPEKFLIYTEACGGAFPWSDPKVKPGSWTRGETYMNNIITDINHNVVGWIDWNLCLNPKGGPNWVENFVDSPILVFAEDDHFEKQPMFYAMAHIAKFVDRGSYRIKVVEQIHSDKDYVEQFAVLTPNNTVVVVLANTGDSPAAVGIKLGNQLVDLDLLPRSFTTVELPNELASHCELKTEVFSVPGKPLEVDYDETVSVTYNPC